MRDAADGSVNAWHRSLAATGRSGCAERRGTQLYIHRRYPWRTAASVVFAGALDECVQALARCGATRIVECGPGKVLTGLIKRIDKTIEARAVGTPADIDAARSRVG
jgi:hypothetical protein